MWIETLLDIISVKDCLCKRLWQIFYAMIPWFELQHYNLSDWLNRILTKRRKLSLNGCHRKNPLLFDCNKITFLVVKNEMQLFMKLYCHKRKVIKSEYKNVSRFSEDYKARFNACNNFYIAFFYLNGNWINNKRNVLQSK